MESQDNSDDVIIGRYINELALADAIRQNLHEIGKTPQEQRLANLRNGHVIDKYVSNFHTQQMKRNHHGANGKNTADRKKTLFSAGLPRRSPQPGPGTSSNGACSHQDVDLTWLDDPQTLYLKKKLHVHDSLTFVHNLAQMLSSSCVLDAMKKVKLVLDFAESADKAAYPVFAIDCDGKVICWNKAIEAVTGVTAREMIGRGDYAYAVPFYGIPRPMLIDYLILPLPRSDQEPVNHPAKRRDVLSSRAETVWIQGRPWIIWGRGTRIYDSEGTLVGAVQSIGIRNPQQEVMQPERERPLAAPLRPAGTGTAGIPSVQSPAGTDHRPGYETGLPEAFVQDLESRGLFLHQHPKGLRTAFGELIEKEDDLLRNIETLCQDSRQPVGQKPQLKPSEDLFRHVVMDAREGVVVYNRDLGCILWNTFMEQLSGIPAAAVLGKRAFDMFPSLKDAGVNLLLEQALSGKTVESSDISFHIPGSGKQAWVRLILSPLRDNKDSISGIIGIVQDTTARKVMEYALQTTIMQLMESEEKYRSVFNSKNDPLLLLDTANFCILDINQAASDLYGYPREEFLTLSPARLFTEPEKYQDLLKQETPGLRICRQRRKDGTIFPADISYAGFMLKDHPVLILSVRDLSSVYQITDALRLANTKLNLLIGVTRHDVINNLTVLMGYNDLLKHTVNDTRILGILEKEESALQAVHRQIEFTREYYNLGVKSPVWQNICEASTRAYSQFITTITFSCDTHDLEIYADPLLEKVFYNLFDNAIRHGECVSHIRVYSVREGPDLLIIFGDDGEGILPENKERIFRRGFGKHTGLGLFLTREILAITRIEITETGEYEKGARFELRVPAGLYRFPDSDSIHAVTRAGKMDLHA